MDVKLPIELYTQISEIAISSFDAKIHHISKKPEITPTLIYLLQLGIESFTSGNELVKKPNTDNHTDTIPITENRVRELIENELIPVQSKLDELSEIIYRLTYTDTDTDSLSIAVTERILDNLTDNNTDKLTDSLEVDTDNKTDNDTDKIAPSESPNLPLNEDSPQIVPIAENKPLNEEKTETAIKLSAKQKEILEKMKSIESGKTFESQSKLGDFLGLSKSEKPHLTKIKPLWENIIFSIESVNGSNQLVKL